MTEPKISKALLNAMMQTLNESLKKDYSLANDLMRFMTERNIEIPTNVLGEMDKDLPVSFSKRNPDDQISRLKHSFRDIDLKENIL